MSVVIKADHISKQYRLGVVGHGTLSHDINRLWHKMRGKEDPFLQIGEENDRSKKGGSDYVWALQDVNFEIYNGEVVGFIGRNGAGKSTLLKILSRTTTPTKGEIKVKGRIASLLEVGTGFHPELSGRENIFLNGAILGMSKNEIKRKFDEIVDFAGVERYINTPVKRYSSGMYVRLAFAVAAHLEPEILIVDEVLAVGDAEFQKKCLGKMKDVSAREGRTVLYVSHNMPSILNLCNRCMLLKSGFLTDYGKPEEIVSKYLSGNNINSAEGIQNDAESFSKHAMPYFKLHDFYFSTVFDNENNAILATANKVLEIIIEGEIFEEDNRFNIGYILKNEFGDNIIISFSTDKPESNWLKLNSGNVKIKTTIDTSILNEGRYTVSLLASIHCVKMLFSEEDNVNLNFEILGNRGNSPYWINRRNSILAPYIHWEKI